VGSFVLRGGVESGEGEGRQGNMEWEGEVLTRTFLG
jgi:hypothetical protein